MLDNSDQKRLNSEVSRTHAETVRIIAEFLSRIKPKDAVASVSRVPGKSDPKTDKSTQKDDGIGTAAPKKPIGEVDAQAEANQSQEAKTEQPAQESAPAVTPTFEVTPTSEAHPMRYGSTRPTRSQESPDLDLEM